MPPPFPRPGPALTAPAYRPMARGRPPRSDLPLPALPRDRESFRGRERCPPRKHFPGAGQTPPRRRGGAAHALWFDSAWWAWSPLAQLGQSLCLQTKLPPFKPRRFSPVTAPRRARGRERSWALAPPMLRSQHAARGFASNTVQRRAHFQRFAGKGRARGGANPGDALRGTGRIFLRESWRLALTGKEFASPVEAGPRSALVKKGFCRE